MSQCELRAAFVSYQGELTPELVGQLGTAAMRMFDRTPPAIAAPVVAPSLADDSPVKRIVHRRPRKAKSPDAGDVKLEKLEGGGQ